MRCPFESLVLELLQDRFVIELLEGKFALLEHLPHEDRVRVDVALR